MPLTLPEGTIIEPSDDSLFCKMYAQTEVSRPGSNIVVPQSAREEVFFAQVVKVGPGAPIDIDKNGNTIRRPMAYNPGDDIFFIRFRGERLQIGDFYYVLLGEGDVLARIAIPEKLKGTYVRFAEYGIDDNILELKNKE